MLPCACDRGVDSIVHTPECGSRRFFCIDGVHLDCLDHFLLETNKKHSHTGEISTTNAGIQTYLSTCVATFHRFVSDIDMEDGDDAGSHLPAVDDLSNDETEGSGSSEESDVFDVRRREDEPWSETASSSEDGHDDDGGGGIEAANEALLTELDADAVTASEMSSSPFRRFEEETAKVVNIKP